MGIGRSHVLGQDSRVLPAPGVQSASPWQPMWALGGSQDPGISPHSALSTVYLKVLQVWGCPEGRTGKEAESNQLQNCLEQGAQSGCDHEKWSPIFTRQDLKCCASAETVGRGTSLASHTGIKYWDVLKNAVWEVLGSVF